MKYKSHNNMSKRCISFLLAVFMVMSGCLTNGFSLFGETPVVNAAADYNDSDKSSGWEYGYIPAGVGSRDTSSATVPASGFHRSGGDDTGIVLSDVLADNNITTVCLGYRYRNGWGDPQSAAD